MMNLHISNKDADKVINMRLAVQMVGRGSAGLLMNLCQKSSLMGSPILPYCLACQEKYTKYVKCSMLKIPGFPAASGHVNTNKAERARTFDVSLTDDSSFDRMRDAANDR